MTSNTIGDLAQSWGLQRSNAYTKANLARLSQELADGKSSEIILDLRGDLSTLSALENDISRTQSYISATRSAGNRAAAVQQALATIQSKSEVFATQLLIADGPLQQMGSALAREAAERFGDISTLLNTRFAGKSLFAGTFSGQPAVIPGTTALAGLFSALGGDTSLNNIRQTVSDWFDVGGGFETSAYLGSTDDPSPARLGSAFSVSIDVKAETPEIRSILKGFALAAMAEHANETDRIALLKEAGETLLGSEALIGDLRAKLGFAEQRIEAHSVELNAKADSYELARVALIGKDPFETAGALQQAQTQMELLYTLTARLSSLTLVNFIR